MAKSHRIPEHLRIRESLLDQIKELPPNARLPTEVVLAGQFGVSRLTVHKVMTRLQQEGLVVRRGKGGTFVAREAHRVQRGGFRGRNGCLAIAYPNWFSYDFWIKVDIAERLALQHGMVPVTIKLNPDTPVTDIADLVRTEEARGLLLIAPGGTVPEADVRALEQLGCPCVLLEPNPHVRDGQKVFSVAPDYREIGRMHVRLLAEQGHARIAYVREEPWSVAGELLLEGLREEADARGLPPSTLVTPPQRTRPWGDAATAGYERTRALLESRRPPTAFIYDALSGAHSGSRALREMGLSIPRDASVLMSAPDHPYARFDWPRIGGISASPGEIVERAVQALLAPPRSPTVRIAPTAIQRESVAAALRPQESEKKESRVQVGITS